MTARRVLIYGGEPSPYHDFSAQGPILAELAREAGWEPELTCDGDAFLPARVAPFHAVMVAASSGPDTSTSRLRCPDGRSRCVPR